jgi:hypothetical protein
VIESVMNLPDMLRVAALAKRWLPEGGAADVARFVRGRLQPDGGFCGRAGGSDLYYTVFGGGCLLALGEWANPVSVVRYLNAFGGGAGLDFVHSASLVRCRAAIPGAFLFSGKTALLDRLEACRASDGGYNPAGPGLAEGTVYGGYLAFLAYDESGGTLPRPEALLASLNARRASDGGYVNAPGVPAGTTPATAAAVLLRRRLAGTGDPQAEAALLACEGAAGGFRASTGAPVPDLLSTATALYALRGSGAKPAHPRAHFDFVESLWDEGGGFRGHAADPAPDCEYTFYALLALGCLHDG